MTLLTLDAPVSFDEHGGLPPFVGTGPDIAFAVRPAVGGAGRTLALLGGFRLGAPYVNVYGVRPTGAMQIVAVEAASGRVHTAVPADPYELPVVHAMRDDDGAGFGFGAVSGQFTVDLGVQLGLPPVAGDYHVFVWLDDLATAPVPVHLPADPRRAAFAQASSPLRPAAAAPRFGRLELVATPQARPGELTLTATRGDDGCVRVEGSLPSAAPEPADPADPVPGLTVLAYQYSRRDVAFATAPSEAMRAAGAAGFRVDVRPPASGRPDDRLFVLATRGGLRSRVAVVALEAPQRGAKDC